MNTLTCKIRQMSLQNEPPLSRKSPLVPIGVLTELITMANCCRGGFLRRNILWFHNSFQLTYIPTGRDTQCRLRSKSWLWLSAWANQRLMITLETLSRPYIGFRKTEKGKRPTSMPCALSGNNVSMASLCDKTKATSW